MNRQEYLNNKVKQIKESGGRIKVYHGRVFINNEGNIIDICNKRDFSKNINNDGRVSSFGGFTIVTIVEPNGNTKEGKYNVKSKQQFNRKLGYQNALVSALNNK